MAGRSPDPSGRRPPEWGRGYHRWAAVLVCLQVVLVVPGLPGSSAPASSRPAPGAVLHAPTPSEVADPVGLVGGFYAHPGGPAPATRLPAYCSYQAPAETLPLNPVERARALECSHGAELPAHGPDATPFDPSGFGLYNLQMTYDASDGYVLLLGATGTGPLNGTQTWAFSGGNWTEIYPLGSPESCLGSALAYDDSDGYVVYLGGANIGSGANCASAGETWSFHAGSWNQLHPTSPPPARQAAAMTNDSRDGYLLLFGGLSPTCTIVCNDTWTFSAGEWTQLAPTLAPSNRSGAGMTYDALDGYVLLFGGTTSTNCTPYWNSYCMLRDTWAYAGGAWTPLSPAGAVPPEPYDDGLVYDAYDQYSLYTVTDDNYSSQPELYWNFSLGNWTDLTQTPSYASAPPNRLAEALAYDWKDGYVVMYGGYSAGWGWHPLNDTWTFQSNGWTNRTLPPSWTARLTITPAAVDLGRSIEVNTSVIGPADVYHFLYYGLPPGCGSPDLATFSCVPTTTIATWVTVTVTNSTGAWAPALAYVSVVPAVTIVAFGAYPPTVALFNQTTLVVEGGGGVAPLHYGYGGLPPGCLNGDSPSLPCTPSAVGTYLIQVNVSDALGVSAVAVTRLNVSAAGPPPPPTISRFQVVPAAVFLGGGVVFSLTATGVYPLSYAYVGLPPGCLNENWSAIACVPSGTGTFNVTVFVTDALGQASSARVTLTVEALSPPSTAPPLSISEFFASPAALPLGASTVLEVFATGGRSPYHYEYTSLPPGCLNADTATLTCTPAGNGTWSVRVLVVDSGANPGPNSTSATTSVVVAPGLTVGSGGGTVAGGPTWTELVLGLLSVSLAALLVMVVFSRRSGSV